MRRRLSLALTAALLALPTLHVQARADATPAILTLQGSTTAWVDVTLRRKVTIDYAKTAFQGGERFVGFYAEDLGRPAAVEGHTLGAVQLHDFHGPAEAGITENLSPFGSSTPYSTTLEAGRYRFYLLADGPAVMRVALTGGPRLTLRPRHRAYAEAAVRNDIKKSMIEADNVQPLVVAGERAIVTSAIMFGPVRRAFLGGLHACVARGRSCGDYGADAGSFPGFAVYPLGEFDVVYGVLYEPGVVKPGALTARQGVQNVTTIEYASAAAFTLSLT